MDIQKTEIIKVLEGIAERLDEVVDKIITGTLEGGESLCRPGSGKGYGIEKTECEHPDENKS